MATKPQRPEAPAAAADDRLYPHIETFLESSDASSAPKLFHSTKAKLQDLSKGAKAAPAKKAAAGIARAEGLLTELLELRAKLEAQAREAKNTRK